MIIEFIVDSKGCAHGFEMRTRKASSGLQATSQPGKESGCILSVSQLSGWRWTKIHGLI